MTQTLTKKDLWLRLNGYHFNHLVPPHLSERVAEAFGGVDASTKAFAHKLTRKLGWTIDLALRAIAEYKKYVYLGMVSDFSVTPSKIIDQVWHEHLLFTRAYANFCQEILCRDFDHNPELVPADDQTGVFQAQYLATLNLYRKEFGIEPPPDIWSVPKFKTESLKKDSYEPRKKIRENDDRAVYNNDDTPLYMFFDGPGSHSHGHQEFGGFSGGSSGGAGAGASWNEPSHSHSDDHGSHDSGGHGDSGSSDGGGSSCSSGCGGGGCGGG